MQSPACGLCPSLAECSAPPEALNPVIPAEEVCIGALRATEPRSARSLAKVSSLIEQGFSRKEPELVVTAEDIVSNVVENRVNRPVETAKAYIYDAYRPLLIARAEGRQPDRDEIEQVANTLYQLLPEYRAYQDIEPDGYRDIVEKADLPDNHMEGQRNVIQGAAGEAVVLYLSLHSYLHQEGTILYPSSYREDNPPSKEAFQLYSKNVHDAHTFDADDSSERTLVSVKAIRSPKSHGSTTVTRVDLLVLARDTVNEVTQIENQERVELVDILIWLEDAEDTEMPDHYNDFCKRFRNKLSEKVQDKIATGPAEVQT